MKKTDNEVVVIKNKAGVFLCVTNTSETDIPMEFPNVQKAMEFLQIKFDHPNLYDDYEYELRPSCKPALLQKI
jgi:hypothetical protein